MLQAGLPIEGGTTMGGKKGTQAAELKRPLGGVRGGGGTRGGDRGGLAAAGGIRTVPRARGDKKLLGRYKPLSFSSTWYARGRARRDSRGLFGARRGAGKKTPVECRLMCGWPVGGGGTPGTPQRAPVSGYGNHAKAKSEAIKKRQRRHQ